MTNKELLEKLQEDMELWRIFMEKNEYLRNKENYEGLIAKMYNKE